jgi:hypothetical protein
VAYRRSSYDIFVLKYRKNNAKGEYVPAYLDDAQNRLQERLARERRHEEMAKAAEELKKHEPGEVEKVSIFGLL